MVEGGLGSAWDDRPRLVSARTRQAASRCCELNGGRCSMVSLHGTLVRLAERYPPPKPGVRTVQASVFRRRKCGYSAPPAELGGCPGCDADWKSIDSQPRAELSEEPARRGNGLPDREIASPAPVVPRTPLPAPAGAALLRCEAVQPQGARPSGPDPRHS